MTSLTENIDHFLEPVNSATVASLPYAHGDLPQSAQTLDQYLDAVEERWNQRIDREVKTLGDGLEKMLDHLDVRKSHSTKSPLFFSPQAYADFHTPLTS